MRNSTDDVEGCKVVPKNRKDNLRRRNKIKIRNKKYWFNKKTPIYNNLL